MKKFAIIVIVIASLVVIGANLFLSNIANDSATPAAAERDNTTLRTTTSGDVVGFRDAFGARAWMGIPFAAAPVGNERWRAPRPPAAWTGTREALAAGPLCPQFASLLSGAADTTEAGAIAGDEDCLYLNLWAPSNAQKLPVMVWIHGGGNTIGHGGSYIGARLAAEKKVILITINYRLGVFGWFSHEALVNGDPADSSGNYGTLDIVRALQWTRDNVANFGGDPNNVTVFGESAGGFDTLAMIASPQANDLFHRAIVQSGGFGVTEIAHARDFASAGGHPNSSSEILTKLLVADGTAADIETARAHLTDLPKAQVRDYLYNTTPEQLFAVLDGGGFGMINLPENFADGYVLPKLSNEEIFGDPNNHNMVPTILGTNRDEPALFMVRSPEWVSNFLWLFPRLKDEAAYLRAVKYGALSWKERGVDSIATLMRNAGNEQVFAYRFDWDELPSIMGYDLSTALGAAHGLEIAFAFGEFERGMGLGYLYTDSANKDELAQTMMSYWTEFARTGNPGTGGGTQTQWTAFGNNGDASILLDLPTAGITMSNDTVTLAGLKTQLAEDTEITSTRERCQLYARSFQYESFDAAEYETFGPDGCADFPAADLRAF